MTRKAHRSKRPDGARSKRAPSAAVARFCLRGTRALTHRDLRELLTRTGAPVAWGRPGADALVVMRAEDFAALTGRGVPETTFAPSRFCRACDRFTGGRACLHCNPPTVRAQVSK